MADESALVQAWRDGDQQAGAELYDRYYPSIARFFRNKVGVESSDLIQATFLACVEGLGRIQGTSFRSYVFGIACNLLRVHYRRRSRSPIDFESVSAHDLDPSPSSVLAANERQRCLLEALRRIPVELQIVLELFYWESMTAKEIGEILQIPVGTAKTRIRRARQLLEEQAAKVGAQGSTVHCSLEELDAWAERLRVEALAKVRRP